MSVLYLHFESPERDSRVQKLAKSGAHILVSEPRWPGFFELAKKEKPYAVAVDFSHAPSHALETADYLAKARETREASFYLLRVPQDRTDFVKKRLPQASIVTEQELAEKLVEAEREAQARALERKEAAAQARKNARARKILAETAAVPLKAQPPARASRPARPQKETRKGTKKKSPVRKGKKGSGKSPSRVSKKK